MVIAIETSELEKLRFRGEYDPETWYKKMDVVTNGNHAYLVQIDNKRHRLDDTQYFMALMQGRPGDPGKNGKSAYDLAVEYQGFNGTVFQWLASLRGEQGLQGSPGQLNGLITDLSVASYPDADAITSKNIYALDGVQKNLPRTDVTKSFMLVLANGTGDTVTQVWFDPVNVELYIRAKSGGKWSDWRWITLWN